MCNVAGCDRDHYAKGWCNMHWQRWRRYGDVGVSHPTLPSGSDPRERLEFYGWTVTDTECWEWGGPREVQGYGTAKIDGKTYKTHRLAYETWVGPIPDGKYILHSCDNPPCINPAHLRAGTKLDNARDREVRERNGRSKMTVDQVLEARSLYGSGGCTYTQLAKRYSVSTTTIARIIRNQSWSHL